MEENKKCDCLVCCCNDAIHKAFGEGGGKHRLLRWVIGLLILWAIFALGVKVGELKYTIKDGLRGSYGFYGCGHGHDGKFFPNMMNQDMMNFWSGKLQNATSTR